MARRVTARTGSSVFFWLLALTGVTLVFAVTTLPALGRNRALTQKLGELEQENGHLRQQLQQLTLEEQALRSDVAYNEALARRELGLVKPHEEILWTPPPHLRSLTPSPLEAEGTPADAQPAGPSWAAVARLGAPGRYLARVLERISTDRSARRDAVLLAVALLTAAFLLFGNLETPAKPRSARRTSQRPTS